MSDEPTLGEVMRQVQSLVLQIQELVREVRSEYVRKDLYDAKHTALSQRVTAAEMATKVVAVENDDRERDRKAFQRQVIGGLIVGGILLLASTAFTLLFALGGI